MYNPYKDKLRIEYVIYTIIAVVLFSMAVWMGWVKI